MHGKDLIHYQIRDDTNNNYIPISRFISHFRTKAAKTLHRKKKLSCSKSTGSLSTLIITSATWRIRSNIELKCEDNYYKEVDTLLINNAALISKSNPPGAESVIAHYNLLRIGVRSRLSAANMDSSRIRKSKGFSAVPLETNDRRIPTIGTNTET